MPGFVKTKADEARWSKAKEAASKSTSEGSEGFWKLSNYIFHRMGKTEEDMKMAEVFKKALLNPDQPLAKSIFVSASDGISMSESSPKLKVPGLKMPKASKMPKAKKMPSAMDKPSKFFKSEIEEFPHVKHPSLMKLKDFLLEKQKKQRKSII